MKTYKLFWADAAKRAGMAGPDTIEADRYEERRGEYFFYDETDEEIARANADLIGMVQDVTPRDGTAKR